MKKDRLKSDKISENQWLKSSKILTWIQVFSFLLDYFVSELCHLLAKSLNLSQFHCFLCHSFQIYLAFIIHLTLQHIQRFQLLKRILGQLARMVVQLLIDEHTLLP